MKLNLKYYDYLLIICLTLIISSFIIISSSLSVINDKDFYNAEFDKNKVYLSFEDPINANIIKDNLHQFFDDNDQLLDVYTLNESRHLNDVKNIINLFEKINYLLVFIIVITLFILFYKNYKYSWVILLFTGFFIIFIVILLFLFSYFNFLDLFDKFHRLFFINNSWIFDETSILIKLFPEQFFIDALYVILGKCLFLTLLCFGFSYYLRKTYKLNN